MADEDSIVAWIERLREGDEDAARRVWERYFPRLLGLARTRLAGMKRRAVADEEDVALSVLDSVCQRARRGEYPDVRDGDSLWRLLMTVTSRKAARLVRDNGRLKRGGHASTSPRGDSALDALSADTPDPALEAELTEGFLTLLDRLEDDQLQLIALWKMDGHTNAEIARKLGCADATVERRLVMIRKTWEQDAAGRR